MAQVCYRLDGIPLAIELAAARTKVLSVEEISARLGDSFRLLAAGSRTAMPRQRTLHATMDWSHELLSQKERVLFRRLSVFAGGFTLEAAESICAGEELQRDEVLELLSQLVDKSLVVAQEDGTGRRATACWRRSASTGGRGSRRWARQRMSASGTRDTTWRWRKRPSRS